MSYQPPKSIDLKTSRRLFLGLKFLRVSGELLRIVREQGNYQDFWREVFKQLPKDAEIVEMPFGQMFLQDVAPNSYNDSYLLLIGSREFPLVAEGARIPPIESVQINRDASVTNLTPAKWYWRWYVRIAEKFVKWFPEWIKY